MGVNILVKKILDEVGINSERYNLQWASAAEAPRFVKLITGFTDKIREMGPLGQAESIDKKEAVQRIEKALALCNDRKLRMGFGNVTKALRKEGSNVNNEIITQVIDEKLSKTIDSGLGK